MGHCYVHFAFLFTLTYMEETYVLLHTPLQGERPLPAAHSQLVSDLYREYCLLYGNVNANLLDDNLLRQCRGG